MRTAEWIAENKGSTKAGFARFLEKLTEAQKDVHVGLPLVSPI